MTVISINDMRKALRQTLGKKGMAEDNIEKIARYIMAYFGFSDHVVDNRLSASERDIFYMLEEENLLKTYQEEVPLKRGKNWRLHYWVMRKNHILDLVKEHDKVCEEKPDEPASNIYDDPSIWERDSE